MVGTLPGNRVGKGRGGRIERGKGEAFGEDREGKGGGFWDMFFYRKGGKGGGFGDMFVPRGPSTCHPFPWPISWTFSAYRAHPPLRHFNSSHFQMGDTRHPSHVGNSVRFRQISSRHTTTFATQQQQSDYIRAYFGF